MNTSPTTSLAPTGGRWSVECIGIKGDWGRYVVTDPAQPKRPVREYAIQVDIAHFTGTVVRRDTGARYRLERRFGPRGHSDTCTCPATQVCVHQDLFDEELFEAALAEVVARDQQQARRDWVLAGE